MPRRSNPLTYLALGWLVALVLAAHAGVPAPDGLGMAVVGLTLWSCAYLYLRLCRRWPAAGWLAFGSPGGRALSTSTPKSPSIARAMKSPSTTTTATLLPTTPITTMAAARRTHGGTEMSNELVLKKLFALAQNKPAPARERTVPNTPTIIPRKLKLPRDAHVQWQEAPPELYLSMTITRRREIEALYETLELFSRLLDEDD